MSTTSTSTQVPRLRFPGFEGEWRDCALGEVASVKHGFAFDGEHFASEGDFIVLTPGNFTADGAFRYQGAKEKFYTSNEFPQEYVLSRGDLLMVMTEQAVGLIGCTLLVPKDGRLLHNQRLGLIQIHGAADAEYLHRYFKTERMRVALSKTGAGTKVRHTSPKRIEGLQINLPTLPEQQKIAAFLTAVDGQIEQLSRKKALLEAYKKGVMQQLFTQTLRFQDDHGHEFPDWEEKALEDVFVFSTGRNIKQGEASPDFAIPCVRYGELYHMYGEVITTVINRTNIDESELKFSDGDEILLPSAGEDPMDIGSASALTIKGVAIGRTINVLKPKQPAVYEQRFASYYINQRLKKPISRLAKGKSISNVYNSDLKQLKISLPSLAEQTKIAGLLSALDGKIGAVGEQMRQTQAWKKGLLQQMFV